jgi:SulP family sulfate permease
MTRLVQLDTTGLEGLENLRDKLEKRGCTLLLCGLNTQPESLLSRSGFLNHVGENNIAANIDKAMERAYILLPNLMGGEEDY